MMDSLIFIRHAETDLAGRFCGQLDPPVNTRGGSQISELVKVLASEKIDAIYSSDLLRAVSTAAAIGEASGLSPMAVSALREIGFGEWEGLSWSEIESWDPEYARRWLEEYPWLPAPGGETFAAFQSRVLGAVDSLIEIEDKQCAAVVTHAGVMRVVLRSLCAMEEKETWERTRAHCSFFRYRPLRAQRLETTMQRCS